MGKIWGKIDSDNLLGCYGLLNMQVKTSVELYTLDII
jgi:hypothetical protein